MAICSYICKTLILAFFAINAWNRFSSAPKETEAFKRNLKALESSFKTRIYPNYNNQVSDFAIPHAHSLVYYGSIAQLVFSVLGIFCGFSSAIAGLIFFKFQVVALNFANINFTDLKDLEKYSLAVSLFVVTLAMCCCSSKCRKTGSCPIRSSDASKSHEQSRSKKRD